MGLYKGFDEGGHEVVRYFPADDIAQAQGFIPASPAEAGHAAGAIDDQTGGALGAIGAGASSLLSGATVGLSDLALRGLLSDSEMARVAADRAAHPVLSGAAGFAGALAPAVLSGGALTPAGLTARAGAGVRGALGGGFAGAIAGGATEGAIFGAGQGVSNLALSGDPLTVEHIGSELSSNMLYGAGFGAGLGAGGKALELGLQKAKGAVDRFVAARQAARELAEDPTAIGSADVGQLDRRGLEKAEDLELLRIAAERAPEKQGFVHDLDEFASDMRDKQISRAATGAADRDAREAGKVLYDADKDLRRVTRDPVGLAENPKRVESALRVQQNAMERLRDWGEMETAKFWEERAAAPGKIREEIMAGTHPDYPARLTPEGLENAVDREMHARYGTTPGPELESSKTARAAYGERLKAADVLHEQRLQAIREEIASGKHPSYPIPTGESAPALSPRGIDMAVEREMQARYGVPGHEQIRAEILSGRHPAYPKPDYLTPEGLDVAVKAEERSKQIRAEILSGRHPAYPKPDYLTPEGLDVAVKAADRVGRAPSMPPEVNRAAGSLPELPRNLQRLNDLPAALEQNRKLQEQLKQIIADPQSERLTAIRKAKEALGAPKQPSLGSLALKTAAKFAGPLGAVAQHGAGALSGLTKAAGAVAERAAKSASTFFDVAAKGTARAPLASRVLNGLRYGSSDKPDEHQPQDLPGAYKRRTDEIKRQVEIAPDGSYQMTQAAREELAKAFDGIRPHAPILADRLEAHGARKIAWLGSQIPRMPDAFGASLGPVKWQASDLEMRSFARKADAAEHPLDVLDRVISGHVTPEDVMAMIAVYPEMRNAYIGDVSANAGTLRKTLPYERKLAISIFTGVPLDPAMHPNVSSVLQGQFTAEAGSMGGTQAPKAMPQFGSVAKSLDQPTPAQHRAQGVHL